MSRKGKLPVKIPGAVEVTIQENEISVKGPKGTLKQQFISKVDVRKEGDEVLVTMKPGYEEENNFQGLYRTLIENLVEGVTKGFEKRLEMIGVGYRAAVEGPLLDLQIGLSHPCKLEIPQGLEVTIDKKTTIVINGSDKQLLGQFAANVRSQRPPEPYQGKGIRYVGEFVRRKAGKAAAKK